MLNIFCKNTKTYKSFLEGTTLLEMLSEFSFDSPYPVVSAKVNNVSQGLKYRVFNNRDVEFLDVRDASGMRVYTRSLSFLLCKAATEVLPDCRIFIEHPLSNGYYCNLVKPDGSAVADEDIEKIKGRMQELVDKDLPFRRHDVRAEEAIQLFRELGKTDKVKLLETSHQLYQSYYTLGGTPDYYYGCLVPSTGFLKVWDIMKCYDGILLRCPDSRNPEVVSPYVEQPKTFSMFAENLKWNLIMDLDNVGELNLACSRGQGSDLIQIAEALQSKKTVQIAEEIYRRHYLPDSVKVVLITGPSASGKTTFCKNLSIQLKACGIKPVSISTDDYFVNRVDTPKLPDGNYDFDNFDTIDHDALQKDVLRLLAGEQIQVPEYNFVTGIREYNGKTLSLGKGTVLLIEGLHALNPKLTNLIPEASKFRIFISTLTSISLDHHNAIPTSDNRLLRRIIRDHNKGAFTAQQTISQWPNVCEAEGKWIYPYQEQADVMFNSAYLVEFAVLRDYAEPILRSVPKDCPEYAEAHRLLHFLSYFISVPGKEIPKTSLMRAFIS